MSATGKGPFRLQLPLLSSVTALSTADKGQLGLPRGAFPVLEHGLGLGAILTEFYWHLQGRGAPAQGVAARPTGRGTASSPPPAAAALCPGFFWKAYLSLKQPLTALLRQTT